MSDNAVPERLRTIIADVFGASPDDITAESAAGELEGWDSFGHLQAILALETEFNLQIDPAKIPELITVDKIQQELEAGGVTWD